MPTNWIARYNLTYTPSTNQIVTSTSAVSDVLAEVYGFRLEDHDQYEFHITMSYQMAAFTADEQSAYRMLKTHIQHIVKAAPIVELGVPEYCTFPDMFRFDPQKLLTCSFGGSPLRY